MEYDYKEDAIPEEINILSQLPEDQKNLVFNEAGKTHCANLDEWLRYLRSYVEGHIRLQS